MVLLFRADLFDRDDTATPPSAARPSVSSTSSTTVVSSASGTVALGPRQSFLDKGELNRALGSLTKGEETRQALTVVVQERLLSVVFSPAGAQTPGFDSRALPYDRFPALVEETTTTLGVPSPLTWEITADRLTGSLIIRVVVTGADLRRLPPYAAGRTTGVEPEGHPTVAVSAPLRADRPCCRQVRSDRTSV